MRVLFVARHHTYFRNFDSVIRELAMRGHQVHLAAERDETLGGLALVESLAAEYPQVSFGEAPSRDDDWVPAVTRLRLAIDYLRYADPMYDDAPRLRSRAAERAPLFAVRAGSTRWARVGPVRKAMRGLLRSAEQAVPASARIDAFLRAQRPDVLLITPLIGVIESPQPDYLAAARRLGIPTALCVWSWDHLSSKALIHDAPDRVLVWNGVQHDEAVRLHGVASDRIVITGAQCFDRWFNRQPSRSRQEFCREAGLDPDRPLLLYVGSALFRGSPSEAAFAARWVEQIRASADPQLRSASLLLRPHPQRLKEWDAVDWRRFENVAVWSGNPVSDQARADYFDALYHSAAVAGLNTSAFLEAGIARRPVLAILPSEFRENQEGTIHFHYLTTVAGGLLRVSRSLPEHERQLADVMAQPPAPGLNDQFVQAFIRPRGLDVPATPLFVDAVESLEAVSVAARRTASMAGRVLLKGFLAVAGSRAGGAWMMDEEERESQAWREAKVAAAADQRRAQASEQQAKAARKQTRDREKRERLDAWRRDKRQRVTSTGEDANNA